MDGNIVNLGINDIGLTIDIERTNNNISMVSFDDINEREIYGIMISSCESLIHGLIEVLQIMKLSRNVKQDPHLIVMFWYFGNQYRNNTQKAQIFLDQILDIILTELKDISYFNIYQIKIMPLWNDDNVYIPEGYLKDKYNGFKGEYSKWRISFNKLLFYGLYEQFTKIIALDNDLLFMDSIQELFDIKEQSFAVQTGSKHINGGVGVIIPSVHVFNIIKDRLLDVIQSNDSDRINTYFEYSEQSFLNMIFTENSMLNVLNSKWNMIFRECYRLNKIGINNIKIWHFTTSPKPWKMYTFDKINNKYVINEQFWYVKKDMNNKNNGPCLRIIYQKWLQFYNTIHNELDSIQKMLNKIDGPMCSN